MALELASGLTSTEAERLLQAEALVRSYCRWHIAPSRAAVVVTLLGHGGRILLLGSLQVTAVASVTEDGIALTSDDYTWQANGVLTREGRWAYGKDVVVTFTHGYAAPPPEVSAIVQSIASRAIQNPGSLVRTQDGPFADTFSQTGFNQSLPMALLDAERAVLAPYRIAAVA